MKWLTDYEEVKIISETEEDIRFLKQLAERLPVEAFNSYDIGEFETIDNKNHFSIIFYI